jgi:N-methylhydantoinase A/acetone carboxylase beta subunit
MTIEQAPQLDDLVAEFERAYGKIYARSASSPELGYLVTHAIVLGAVDVEKPALPEVSEHEAAAPLKGVREAWWESGDGLEPIGTDLYELDEIAPGATIVGPAIVESVATTFAVPPGRAARLDRHRIFHMSTTGEEQR